MNNSGCLAYLTVILGAILAFLGIQQTPTISPRPTTRPAIVTPTPITNRITPTRSGVTPTVARPVRPPLSLAGMPGKIAFIANRPDYDIYIINADGTNPTNITKNADIEWSPVWSPDGTQLVYAKSAGTSDDYKYQLYVAQADGSNEVKLTDEGVNWGIAWSHDGSKVAFASNREGEFQIFVMNADGSNPTRLTNTKLKNLYPSWSRDDKQIAFVSSRDKASNDQTDVYVMNADGSDVGRITTTSGTGEGCYSVAWSPIEDKLAFRCFYNTQPNKSGIYTAAPDGSDLARLETSNPQDSTPVWSPDGRYLLVFDLTLNYPAPMYIFDIESGARALLSASIKAAGSPANWWGGQ